MRPLYLIVGTIVALVGVGWSLQGAYLIPATFMRGPAWVGAGAAVAAAGVFLAYLGIRKKPSEYGVT